MNITNSDLEFLIKLENKLGSPENWSEDVIGLWEMIERLKVQKVRSNEKIRNNIREKRKSDPGYGRSKQEKEKINKKNKEV